MKYITRAVFIAQFFNTGLLLMIVNADFSKLGIPFISKFLRGNDPDFNQRFFIQVGDAVVGAMKVNMYMPAIEAIGQAVVRELKRLLDRKFTSDVFKTSKKSISAYVDLYAGPNYSLHFKYSSVLNIVFVTMMFGVAMPILYPIACLSLWTLYMVEKYCLYYTYKQPPKYDEQLNADVLNIMSVAPFINIAFGYWFLSNKQLLIANGEENYKMSLEFKTHKHIAYNPNHNIVQAVLNPVSSVCDFGPAGVLFIYFFFLFALRMWGKVAENTINDQLDQENEESIDTYFKCLDNDDRNWSLEEEKYARRVFKFDNEPLRMLYDYSVDKLEHTKLGNNHLTGIHSYDILRNPNYVGDFQYKSPSNINRLDQDINEEEDL